MVAKPGETTQKALKVTATGVPVFSREFPGETLKRIEEYIVNQGGPYSKAILEKGVAVAQAEAANEVLSTMLMPEEILNALAKAFNKTAEEVKKEQNSAVVQKEIMAQNLKIVASNKTIIGLIRSSTQADIGTHLGELSPEGLTSAATVWSTLKAALTDKSAQHKTNLKEQFDLLNVNDFECMKEFFDAVDIYVQEFKSAGIAKEDSTIISELKSDARGFSEEYKVVLKAFSVINEKDQTYESFKRVIINEESTIKTAETKRESAIFANYAQGGGRGRFRGGSRGGARVGSRGGRGGARGGRSGAVRGREGRPINCWDCGGNHFQSECTATAEEKRVFQFNGNNVAVNGANEANNQRVAELTANFADLINKVIHGYPSLPNLIDKSNLANINMIVDSGTTKNMVKDREWLHDIEDFKVPKRISTAEKGAFIEAHAQGDMKVHTAEGTMIVLEKVLVVPEISAPLVSVKELTKTGKTVIMGPGDSFIADRKGNRLITLLEKDNLYILPAKVDMADQSNIATEIVEIGHCDHLHALPDPCTDHAYITTSGEEQDVSHNHADREVVEEEPIEVDENLPLCISCEFYHETYGHQDNRVIRKTSTMVTGMPDLTRVKTDKKKLCRGCMRGKMTRRTFDPETDKDRAEFLPGEKISIDLMGPFRVFAKGTKNKYHITILDNGSDYGFVYQMASRLQTAREVKKCISFIERQTGNKLKVVMLDKGGELEGLHKYFESEGIKIEEAAAYQHEQHGKQERFNRTIMEGSLSMIYHRDADISMWAEAANLFNHLRNLTPQAGKNITRYEAFHGIRPDVRHLRPFWSLAYVQVPIERRNRAKEYRPTGKLSEKAKEEMFFVGFSKKSKALRFYEPKSGKFIESATARFEKFTITAPNGKLITLKEFTIQKKPEAKQVKFSNRFQSLEIQELPENEDELTLGESSTEEIPQLDSESENEPSTLDDDENESMNRSPLKEATVTNPEPVSPHQVISEKSIDLSEGPHHVIGKVTDSRRTRSTVIPGAPNPTRTENRPLTRAVVPLAERLLTDSSQGFESVPRLEDETPPEAMTNLETPKNTVDNGAELANIAFSKILCYFTQLALPKIPKSIKQAMKSAEWPQWKKAIENEMNAHEINGTWKLVELPEGKRVIGSKMIFDLKLVNGQLSTERHPFKARLVARGDQQREEIEFKDRFAPTAKATSNRILFALAAIKDWDIRSFDVSTAYLHGDQKHEVYMKPLSGSLAPGDTRVCQLLKGLYGTVDGGRLWYNKLKDYLKLLGFEVLVSDNSVYIRGTENDLIIVSVSTDDCLVFGPNSSVLLDFEREFNKKFKTKSQGPVRHHLGITITRDRKKRTITFHQGAYIDEMLKKFGMENCKPATTPLPTDIYSQIDKETIKGEEKYFPYLELLGTLLYLAIQTRPDISAAVGIMGQYSSNPTAVHWHFLKRILAYVKGTRDKVLKIGGNSKEPVELIGYADADWAGNPHDSKSRSGVIFFINDSTVSYGSFKQATVALSSTESERNAAHEGAKEGCSIRKFLEEATFPQQKATKIYGDNTGCVSQIYNDVQSRKSKHMMIKFNFAKEKVESKELEWEYIPTSQMIADIFTKPLPRESFEKFREAIGVVEVDDSPTSTKVEC